MNTKRPHYEVARVYHDGPKYVVRERTSGKWLTKPTTQREFAARGFSAALHRLDRCT